MGFVNPKRAFPVLKGIKNNRKSIPDMSANHKIIQDVCHHIESGNIENARTDLIQRYPFVALKNSGRRYTNLQKTKIFLRDGFVDRYSGERMIFPPVLKLISNLMPEEFPFHTHWKMSECHLAYWELLPTIDHIKPVARGGEDTESNWVCTSQSRNSAKSNWLLEELGWSLHPPGDLSDWDGMFDWFISYAAKEKSILDDQYIKSWYDAGIRASK